MPKFGKPKSYSDWLYSRPILVILAIAVFFLGFAVVKRLGVEQDMSARRLGAEEERQEVVDRKASLEKKVEYLESERGVEEEIRKHFDVAREGEKVIILMGEAEAEPEADESTETNNKKWYEFWR